jgi:hypothetical protein
MMSYVPASVKLGLRFFLRLCGDLGIRHRTAARMTLENWQPVTRSLTFTTKRNVHQTLPSKRQCPIRIQ